MNENPEGTPNPLNPEPAAAATPPAEPVRLTPPVAPAAPARPVAPQPSNSGRAVDPMMARPNRPVASAQPAEPARPVAPAPAAPRPMNVPINDNSGDKIIAETDAIVEQIAQAMPAETAPAPAPTPEATPEPTMTAPKKKSKKGLIIGLVIALLVALVGGAVAAILILKPFGDDNVPLAIEKLISGQAPSNVAISGTMTVNTADAGTGLNALNINLNAQVAVKAGVNTATAAVTAEFADGTELDFEADEITAEDGDIYLKISGLADSLKNGPSGIGVEAIQSENCVESADGTTNCVPLTDITTVCEGEACDVVQQDSLAQLGYIGMILETFQTVDDQWIQIPSEYLQPSEDTLFNNDLQCLTNAFSTLPNYTTELKNAYNQNPFIEYSTENLNVKAVKNKLYKLSINSEKLANFTNSLNNSGFANELLACTGGTATNTTIDASEVKQMFANYPTIYVEIDDDHNFTRVKLDGTLADGGSVAVDFNLSYPQTVQVTEPTEYLDINTVISAMMQDLYGITVLPDGGEIPPEVPVNTEQ